MIVVDDMESSQALDVLLGATIAACGLSEFVVFDKVRSR